MIGESTSPLKAACYTALTNVSAFMALITGLFDVQAPTNQAFNYVVMGNTTQLPNNTLGKGGRECTIEFEIFTQGSFGSKNAAAIADSLISALVQTTLTLSTTPAQTCVYVDLDNYHDQPGGDGLTFHAIARLLFRTQEQ